jgi:hypothetical protein
MSGLKENQKLVLASYVYRNFIFKDLLSKYKLSGQYKIDHVSIKDQRREKYLQWLKKNLKKKQNDIYDSLGIHRMRPVLKWNGPEAEKNPIHLTAVKKEKTEFGEKLKQKFDKMEEAMNPKQEDGRKKKAFGKSLKEREI